MKNDSIKETATQMYRLGFRIVPPHCKYKDGQTYSPDHPNWNESEFVSVALDNLILVDFDGNKGEAITPQEFADNFGISSEDMDSALFQWNDKEDSLHYLFKHPDVMKLDWGKYYQSRDGVLSIGGRSRVDLKTGNQLCHIKPYKDHKEVFPTDLPMAPDSLVNFFRKPDRTVKTETTTPTGEPVRTIIGHGSSYGLKALEGAREEIYRAVEGTRNSELNKQACAMGSLMAGGEIAEATVRQELEKAAYDIGLKKTEVKSTINSGIKKGKESPRSAPVKNNVSYASLEDTKNTHSTLSYQIKRRNRLSEMSNLAKSIKSPDWLVKDWFEKDSMGCLVAPSYSGKSFLALDLSCSVATGKPWQGYKASKGAVVYIAGEGFNGIRRRLRAWEIKNQITLDGCNFMCSDSPYALGKAYGCGELVEDIKERLGDIKPALIVVDTVARNTAGREENSATDTGVFIETMDKLKRAYGCTILLVHHTGHLNQERGRGSSALYAAQDCEYLMKKDGNDVVEIKCTKMKDGDEPKPIKFKIETVGLGIKDSDGDEVTSAVLVKTDMEISFDFDIKKPTVKQLEVITAVRGREANRNQTTREVLRDDLKTVGINTKRITERIDSCLKNGWLTEDDDGFL
ncbi:helicase RepA family protein, partial [Candidatus Sororendozoicomonas aggregata]|uniref:helicase RepA family protein n=1 Tax=Candidatus Sororendozoicomonas aggregata TaxID=3073239 RepID=UPI002ED40A27